VLPSEPSQLSHAAPVDSSWKSLCVVGGITALFTTALVPAEIVIGLLPGVEDIVSRTIAVTDWFTLFRTHWFLGLRNLGLLNMVGVVLLAPTILAIYSVLRRDTEAYAALAAIIFFVGMAVYLASNRAFPMLFLSHQYVRATTEAQRSLLAAAGQTMLAEAESRSGILVIELALLLASALMLRGRVFSRVTACMGMVGNMLMMILEIAFMPPHGVGMVVAAAGGLSTVVWYFLVGRRLLQLGRLLTGDRSLEHFGESRC